MTSGFLLDTNVPSELTRITPDPRVVQWLAVTDDNLLYLSVITCQFLIHASNLTQQSVNRNP
jgi:tRNA(fMet)-specific endonuclease VapC